MFNTLFNGFYALFADEVKNIKIFWFGNDSDLMILLFLNFYEIWFFSLEHIICWSKILKFILVNLIQLVRTMYNIWKVGFEFQTPLKRQYSNFKNTSYQQDWEVNISIYYDQQK